MGWTFSTPGMLEPPTLDLSKPRPRVRNPDGSISTIRSMGVGFDGKQYLIPTVSEDGRSLSAEEAIEEFKRTHKHLGVYDSIENSNKAAKTLHEQQAAELDKDRPWWNRPLGRSLEGLSGFVDLAALPFEAGYALAGKEAPTFTGSSKWVREKFDLPPVSEDTGLANRVTGLAYQMVGGPALEQLAARGAGLAGRVAKNIIPEHRPRTVQIKPPRPAGDNSWVTPEIRRQHYAEQDWGKNRPYLFKLTTRKEGIEAGALSPVGPQDAYAEVRSGKDYDQLSPEAKRLYDMRANSDEVIGEPVTRKGSLDIDEAQWWQPEEPLEGKKLLWSAADEPPPAPVPGSIQIKPPRPARTKRDIWLEADPSTWGENVRLVPVHYLEPQDYGYGPPNARHVQFDAIHPATGELIGRISGTLDYATGDFNIGSTGAESASRVIAALGPRNPAWRDEYRSGLAGDRAGLYGPRRVRALAEHLKAWMPELKTISSTSRVTGVRGRLGGDARVKPLTVRVRPGTPDYVPRPRRGSLDLTEQELITFESPERVLDPAQIATRNDLMAIQNSIERSLRIEPGRRRLADDERNMEHLMGRFAYGELDPDAVPTSPEREALIEQVRRSRQPRTATGMTLDEAIRDRDTTGVDFNDTPGGIDPITGNPRERPPYPNDLLSQADLEDMERRAAMAASPPRRPITTGDPEQVLNDLEDQYAAAMRSGDTDQMRRLGDQWDLAWRRAYGGSGSPGMTIDEAVGMRIRDDYPEGVDFEVPPRTPRTLENIEQDYITAWENNLTDEMAHYEAEWRRRYQTIHGEESPGLQDVIRERFAGLRSPTSRAGRIGYGQETPAEATDRYVDEQLSAQERDLNPEAAQHEDNIVAAARRREAALEADRMGGVRNRFESEQRDIDRSFEIAENQFDEIQNTGELSSSRGRVVSEDTDEAAMQILRRQGFPHWEEPMSAILDDPRWHEAQLRADQNTANRLIDEYRGWQDRFEAIRDTLRAGQPSPASPGRFDELVQTEAEWRTANARGDTESMASIGTRLRQIREELGLPPSYESQPPPPIPPRPSQPPRELHEMWDRQIASPRGWERAGDYRHGPGSATREYERQRAQATVRGIDSALSRTYRNDMNALKEAARLHQETGQPQMLPGDGLTPPRMLVTVGDYRAEMERIYTKLLHPNEPIRQYSGDPFRPNDLAEMALRQGGVSTAAPAPAREWTALKLRTELADNVRKLLKQ